MTNSEMIKEVKAGIESVSGYSYSEKVLTDIIEAGVVPEGKFYSDSEVTLIKKGNVVEALVDGNVVQSTELTPEAFEQMLMMYASVEAKTSTGTGLR